MVMTVVIIVGLTIFLTGVVVSLSSVFKKNSGSSANMKDVDRHKAVADQGVNIKNLNYGRDSGALFEAGAEEYGTVMRRGGRHRNFEIQFSFIGTGRTERKIFTNRMIIGRKKTVKEKYPFLEIPSDKMISSVHCYLDGRQGILTVQDAGSLNHTYLNGIRVDHPMQVASGSILQVGTTKLHIKYVYH